MQKYVKRIKFISKKQDKNENCPNTKQRTKKNIYTFKTTLPN